MDLVLTPEEAGERLGVDPALVITLCEQGYFSGVRHGDSWRICTSVLIADLERIRRQLQPAPAVRLAPRSDSSFRVPPSVRGRPAPKAPETAGFPERFAVRIEIDNDSDYTGEFALYVSTENPDGPWEVHESGECIRDDNELLIRGRITADTSSRFFDATLQGHLGDRLFLAVPEQRGVDEALEKVFVLEADLSLRLTISNRGLLGRKRAVRIKQLPFHELRRTGTE